jgi:desulfoferrodoxin (superoxide reductase-like protein)
MILFIAGSSTNEQYQGTTDQTEKLEIGQLSLPNQNTHFIENESISLVFTEKNAQNKPSHKPNKLLLGLVSNLEFQAQFYSRNCEQIQIKGAIQCNIKRLLFPYHEFG